MSHPSVECPLLTAPGEPDPPTSLELASLAATSVQLHWKVRKLIVHTVSSYPSMQASVTHGCSAESYEVQYYCDGKVNTISTLSPVCTIGNLHSATSYQARVRVSTVIVTHTYAVACTVLFVSMVVCI